MIGETLLKVFRLEKLAESLTGYLESKVELIKYNVKEDVAEGLSKFIVLVILILLTNMLLLFLSLAIAFHLSEQYGSFIGFALMGSFYLLMLILLILFREPVSRLFEKQFMQTINKDKS